MSSLFCRRVCVCVCVYDVSSHSTLSDTRRFVQQNQSTKSKTCHDALRTSIAQHQRPDVDTTKPDDLIVVIIEIWW